MGKDKWILFTPRKVVVFLLFVVLICTFIEVLTSTTESEKSEKEAVSTTETVIGEIESQLSIEIDTVDLAKLSESLESVLKQGQFFGVALVDQQDQVISSAISHGRRRPDQVSKKEISISYVDKELRRKGKGTLLISYESETLPFLFGGAQLLLIIVVTAIVTMFGYPFIVKAFYIIFLDLEPDQEQLVRNDSVQNQDSSVLQISANELRAPISQFNAYIDVALKYLSMGSEHKVLAILKKCASDIESLDTYITTSMYVANIERTTLQPDLSWVELGDVFDKLSNQFEVKCDSTSGINWECFGHGDTDGLFFIDVQLIKALLSVAIDHAIATTNFGFVRVSYRCNESSLVVNIHDSGPGIQEERLKEAMSATHGIYNNSSNDADCWDACIFKLRKLAILIGASFNIESIVDFGTKITFVIPALKKEKVVHWLGDTAINNDNRRGSALSDINNQGYGTSYVHNVIESGLKILVVDSDSSFLSNMEETLSPVFLRRNDIQVTYCKSSSDAIRHVEEFHYDLLLIDNDMPGMNGLKFLRFLDSSENECRNSTKIVLTSDDDLNELWRREMLSMADKVMCKSGIAADIRNIIRSVSLKSVS